MYEEKKHTDAIGRSMMESEYFVRSLFFPVDKLRISLSLPKVLGPPKLQVFEAQSNIKNPIAGVLYLDPPDNEPVNWIKVADPSNQIVSDVSNSWELVVHRPPPGRAYALEWDLPRPEPASELALSASHMRRRFVEHAQALSDGEPGDEAIGRAFRSIVTKLTKWFPSDRKKHIDVTLMTYNDQTRCLFGVEAIDVGKRRRPGPPQFLIPYGLGIAGACFKESSALRLFIRPEKHDSSPGLYWPSSNHNYEVLLAAPVMVLGIEDLKLPSLAHSWELSRYCVAVINIGSNDRNIKLPQLIDSRAQLRIKKMCDEFAKECAR
jgi:hypothetical protein